MSGIKIRGRILIFSICRRCLNLYLTAPIMSSFIQTFHWHSDMSLYQHRKITGKLGLYLQSQLFLKEKFTNKVQTISPH